MILIPDFNRISTLEFLTATHCVITIWNRADIMSSITHALNIYDININRLLEIDARVLEILYSIENIPIVLKEDWRHLITPIGKLIKLMRTFANFSPYLESLHREFPVDLWTPYGTVDIKELDRRLVQDVRRDIGFRFHLACNDCFEEEIRELYPLLTDAQRLEYMEENNNNLMIQYWIRRLPIFNNFFSGDEAAFEICLLNSNKPGIEYFITRLQREDFMNIIQESLNMLLQQNIVFGIIPLWCAEHSADALYFLLSNLHAHEISGLREYYCDILEGFLCYPFFNLFNTYRAAWMQYLEDTEIVRLLSYIAFLKTSRTHFFGYNLFDDFWFSLSENMRHQVENAHFVDNIYHVFLQEEIRRITQRQR